MDASPGEVSRPDVVEGGAGLAAGSRSGEKRERVPRRRPEQRSSEVGDEGNHASLLFILALRTPLRYMVTALSGCTIEPSIFLRMKSFVFTSIESSETETRKSFES